MKKMTLEEFRINYIEFMVERITDPREGASEHLAQMMQDFVDRVKRLPRVPYFRDDVAFLLQRDRAVIVTRTSASAAQVQHLIWRHFPGVTCEVQEYRV